MKRSTQRPPSIKVTGLLCHMTLCRTTKCLWLSRWVFIFRPCSHLNLEKTLGGEKVQQGSSDSSKQYLHTAQQHTYRVTFSAEKPWFPPLSVGWLICFSTGLCKNYWMNFNKCWWKDWGMCQRRFISGWAMAFYRVLFFSCICFCCGTFVFHTEPYDIKLHFGSNLIAVTSNA